MCHHHHGNSSPPTNDMQSKTKKKRKRAFTFTNKKRKQKRSVTSTVSLEPARKTRTRRKKPKYLSLSLKLDPQKNIINPPSSNKKSKMIPKQQHQQLNLFPLHPENLVDDNKDMHEDNNVVASFLFDTATDSTTTLNGLLTKTSEEEGPLSPLSLTYAYMGQDNSEEGDSNGLVRTAMRCKERDASEERWVSYNEVIVEKKIKEEEASSSVVDDVDADAWRMKDVQGQKRRLSLALKLDYQEILNAWSDKGPLYIDGESPQTVPDLHTANVPMLDGWGNVSNLWSVPEITSNGGGCKVDDEAGGKEGWKREHREASMLRYKEKRQNRLFSKRIRYEVRKLNAEKRPRMKGRFVKRSSEV